MIDKIKVIECTEVDIEYLITGEENKETILFVHGAGTNLRQFIPQHDYFSKDFRVLSISLRGHGNSTNPTTLNAIEHTIKKHRNDILEVLEYLKIKDFHFVGNSAGGMLGLELAKTDSHRLKSLVTFGTTAELKLPKFAVNLISKIDKIMLKFNPHGYCKFISKNSSKYRNVQSEMYDEFIMATQAIPYFRKNIGNYSYLNVLENLKIPYLLIQGEFDLDINKNLKSTIQVLNNNKNASIIKLNGAGHIANLDQPEEFNRIVETFISNNK